tara:strand:+ start:1098 stop:1349 length:252 start_codon:yes stop_codon:yes gene_type:complete
MKTLNNIWDLEQLPNYTLKEIAFELDFFLTTENVLNYNPMNKTDLVCSIYTTLEEGRLATNMTEMIDYLIGLVKEEKITITNH